MKNEELIALCPKNIVLKDIDGDDVPFEFGVIDNVVFYENHIYIKNFDRSNDLQENLVDCVGWLKEKGLIDGKKVV